MNADTLEIDCPVCDRKVRADAPRCPFCGAEFVMYGVDELEKVAREINGAAIQKDTEAKGVMAEAAVASVGEGLQGPREENHKEGVAEAAVASVDEDDGGGRGFLGKLFRKRR